MFILTATGIGVAIPIAAGAVWMVLTGRLVPGRERDHWRDTALELRDQNGILLRGVAPATTEVLRAATNAVRGEAP